MTLQKPCENNPAHFERGLFRAKMTLFTRSNSIGTHSEKVIAMASVIFMGTPEFALPTLRALFAHHHVLAVVTQPDRPAGRGGNVRMSPVKKLALARDVPVFQPGKIRRTEAIADLKTYGIPDVYVVAAFGQILPQDVLDIPAHGSINVHASLLPRWRGAAPIHAAIRAGDDESGVTIMKMDAGLDTGPMLSKRAVPIRDDETAATLHDRLAEVGADLLIDTLPGYLAGEITPQPQNDENATYAPQISKADGDIDWTESADSIERLVRAFKPWPGTYTYFRGQMLKIHAGDAGSGSAAAGHVIKHDKRIAIGTGDGLYYPQVVQMPGKQHTSITDFVNGYQDFVGSTLPDD
jgi:methionyl-tRNA formyltransferase